MKLLGLIETTKNKLRSLPEVQARLGGMFLLPITAVNNQNQVKGPARGAFSPLAEPWGDLGALF